MRNKIILILLLVILGSSGAMSMDWNGLGLTVAENNESESEKSVLLKDDKGRELKVRFYDELDEKWGKVIKSLNSELRDWKWMKVDKIEFFQNNGALEILIIPSSFTYKGTNFLPYIPGGLVFIYDYNLNYNFRLNKDNFFVRINDRFINEVSLCERMKEAADDPISYLKKREPEYFLQKLTELENSFAELKASHAKLQDSVMYYENSGFLGFGNTQISRTTVKKVIELKKDKPNLKAPEIVKTLEKQKVTATEKEVNLILNIFYGEFKK